MVKANIIDLFDLGGKTAMITASGQGMGQGIAYRLADAGANIVVSHNHLDTAEATAAKIRADGGNAVASLTDVTQLHQIDASVQLALDTFGAIDILVNNAGGMHPFTPFLESKIKFADPAHHIAFTEYRLAVHVRTECVERLETALRTQVQSWRSLPVVQALMTLRGIDLLSAVTIIAELGDLRRFPHPRELMGYIGLVPSEHSSGPTRHRGGLTKTGNTHVRRILVEAAWNYRFAARIGESLQPRLEGQPQHVVATAWKAQIRLCARFRRLRARGVHHNKVTAAIARELCGFIWDIGRQVAVRGSE